MWAHALTEENIKILRGYLNPLMQLFFMGYLKDRFFSIIKTKKFNFENTIN